MSNLFKRLKVSKTFIIAAFVLLAVFSACDLQDMGLGDPVDFTPPGLLLNGFRSGDKEGPVPTPFYVKGDTVLYGTATDNIGVTSIIMRNARTQEKMFDAVLIGSNRKNCIWEIKLDFIDWTCINGHVNLSGEDKKPTFVCHSCDDKREAREQIMVEIVAYDRAKNSGDESIIALTLIVDLLPPVIQDMWIDRTSIRKTDLETYPKLKALETSDPRGERSVNTNTYQNGFFTIQGKVSEEETRIEIISLNIFDVERGINEPLLELERDEGSSVFYPRWTITEADLLAAGEEKLWSDYTADYYNGKRYYYRVAIVAIDKSGNEEEFLEEEGFFVMWENADIPKGILDPLIGTVVTKGGTLPVEFFDDDQLLWAYAGLLTKEQWDGDREIASGVTITGATDNEKLSFLRNRLKNDPPLPVYNWKYDRYNQNESEPVKELIDGKKLDERLVYLQTGNLDADYGAFVLFTVVADVKLSPHTNTGKYDAFIGKTDYEDTDYDTNRTREKSRVWHIDVVDENAPVIVLDVQAGCPEENTFPSLSDGERFTITGYTLRENGRMNEPGNNGVIKFRMAWIPARMAGGSDNYIQAVQNALSDSNYPNNFPASLNGVQHWEFNFSDYPSIPINFVSNAHDEIPLGSNNGFRKQPFEREFSILGNNVNNVNNPVPKDASWKDFHSIDSEGNYTLENETKLFIFYAEDNMSHQVFRQMRILGNNTPPDLAVYDITGRVLNDDMPSTIPDVTKFIENGVVKESYYDELDDYNNTSTLYNLFKNVSANLGEEYRTIPFQAYPRDTVLKYWIAAERSGDIAVRSITMTDITYEGQERTLGRNPMHPTDRAMVFAERYPDESQRVFLFEAEDTLGNVARIQRTIAVTNTAMLESITTTTQNGTYGIGQEIILQANFTGQIDVNVASGRPRLNVRYPIYSTISAYNGQYHVQQIEAEPVTGSAMSLQFKFSIPNPDTFSCIDSPLNPCPNKGHGGVQIIALGKLETMYDHADMIGTGTPAQTAAENEINRPIKTNGAVITDALRQGQPAFIPGYTIGTSTMHTWTTSVGSLQNPTGQTAHQKDIRLDAIRPVVSSAAVGGKTAYSGQEYYFKSGETLTITLTSSGKSIKSSSIEPRLQYYIRENPGGTPQGTLRGPYHATTNVAQGVTNIPSTFMYTRPSGSQALVFSLPISDTAYDGEIVQISLVTTAGHGAIEDDVGNTVQSVNVSNIIPAGTRIYVKKAIPAAPAATLGNGNIALQNAGPNFNYAPVLTIPVSSATLAAWEDVREYSLNGGLSWTPPYTTPVTIGNGSHDVRARYVDRAGNNGTEQTRSIVVNLNFPRLQAITAIQGNGTYRIGQRLDFEMSFADTVELTTPANVTITVRDITNTSVADNTMELRATGGDGTSTITFAWTGTAGTNPFINKDMLNGLRITAINISGLTDNFGTPGPSGITLSAVSPWTINMPAQGSNGAYNVPYALSSVIVSTIAPVIVSETPVNAQGKSGNITTSVSSNNRTITLNFNKPVQKGNGTIILRPHGTYAIPAVMEHNGYYVGIDASGQIINDTQGFEIRHTSGGTGRTYVSGFADIFNNISNTEKSNLIGSTNLSEPAVSLQTALPVGPYQRMTHGLTRGMGYTGNYGNTAVLDTNTGATITRPGTNAPGPRDEDGAAGSNFMIPDLETKWVLRYNIPNLFADGTSGTDLIVRNIRAAFTNAKWRWQEFAVTANNVQISGSTVTITLPEPILPGLRWTLYYPAGTFSDVAGNPAVAIAHDEYWFWSAGAQRPVVRVDRKSYDARAGTDLSGPRENSTYAATGFNGAITAFNTINYVITTETPGGRIFFGTREGTQANLSSVTGAWGGIANSETFADNAITAGNNINWGGPLATITNAARATTGNTNEYTSNGHNLGATGRVFQVRIGTEDRWLRVTGDNTFRLYATQAAANTATAANGQNYGDTVTINSVLTTGRWIRPNLIFRNDHNNVYNLMLHFMDLQQTVGGLANTANALTGRFYGFRSFNKDATYTELFAIERDLQGGTAQNHSASFTYTNFEASKNYVIAETRIDHGSSNTVISPRGYEGVFRTVVMLNMSTVTVANNNTPIILFGTNRINGIPTVPAFPLKDGVDQVDARFGKFYFRDESSAAGNGDRNRYYWVSTEIVSSWFIQNYGRGTGGSYTRKGDNNDWITAGYGDLVNTMDIQAW